MTIKTADQSEYNEITSIATGISGFDKLSGIGGFPRKRISEIWGEAGIGKSSICLQLIANAQKDGLKCLFADAEWSFDLNYARSLGVDTSKLGLLQEQHAEAILDALVEEIESGKWDLVVLDSVGGLLPRAEIEKGAEGKVIGGQASLIARFSRKIVPLLVIKDVALVVINHSFTDLMSGRLKTSGGQKLDYHKSYSIRLKKANKRVMSGENHVGNIIEIEVRKNKISNTMGQTAEATLLFGQGFSVEADLLAELLESGEVTRKGNTFFRNGEKLAVGLARAREALKQ